jgi:hypothetical protein
MFTEETIRRDDVREPALSPLDADFAAHAAAIEELYETILTEIADAARAWTPEVARLEAARREEPRRGEPRTGSIPTPRTEPRTEAITTAAPRTESITAPRTDAITVQQPEALVRTRGAHHAETGQMAAIQTRPAVPRNAA